MNEKTFLHQLRRGLGSAIIELKDNPERGQYRDVVLRCSLKDISYDPQIEGTKGYYLYTAICALGESDEFENVIIDAFQKRLEYRLFKQLVDLLCLYSSDGSEKARAALHAKYHSLAEQLARQRTFPPRYCEREQFEYLMINEVDTGAYCAIATCVEDAGRICLIRKDDVCDSYDWFISHCENALGADRFANYLRVASERSAEVKAFVAATTKLQTAREEYQRSRVEPRITLGDYVQRAKDLENDPYALGRMNGIAYQLSKRPGQGDLKDLVSVIVDEQSAGVKANLLRVFASTPWGVDFPGDIDILIGYAKSDCEPLRFSAIQPLRRLRDPRVHDLAVELVASRHYDEALSLLVDNWNKQDEPVVREHVLSSRRVSDAMQGYIRDIYLRHRSKTCGDILEHVYRYGECTFCRFGIVEAMWKSRVLTPGILEECLYDSYDETRELATRLRKHLEK